MNTSEQINELAKALSLAQSEMRKASKDSTNPHFRSSYADLTSIWEACQESLTKNGLSVVQGASAENEQVSIETRLLHASGQWVESKITVKAKDASPQAVGSALTYCRRYSLAAMVGVTPEDDDAESAQPRKPEQAKQSEREREYPKPVDVKLHQEIIDTWVLLFNKKHPSFINRTHWAHHLNAIAEQRTWAIEEIAPEITRDAFMLAKALPKPMAQAYLSLIRDLLAQMEEKTI